MPAGFGLTLIVLLVVAYAFLRRHGDAERATLLRRTGVVVSVVFTLLGALWIAAETFADPGGWLAAGLVSAWALPLAGAAAYMWWRPDGGVVLGACLVGAVIVLGLWGVVASGSWNSFEDVHGPLRTIAVFAVSAPLGLLGWKRPREAGLLLLVVGVVPLLLQAVSTAGVHRLATSMLAVATPYVIAGLLFLVSAALDRHAGGASATMRQWHRPHRTA